MQPTVYFMATTRRGTLYAGVTSDLVTRVRQHKEGIYGGFTKKRGVHSLVWFEHHSSMENAINREKQLKEWKRYMKIQLIERFNPEWRDLYEELCGAKRPPRDTSRG